MTTLFMPTATWSGPTARNAGSRPTGKTTGPSELSGRPRSVTVISRSDDRYATRVPWQPWTMGIRAKNAWTRPAVDAAAKMWPSGDHSSLATRPSVTSGDTASRFKSLKCVISTSLMPVSPATAAYFKVGEYLGRAPRLRGRSAAAAATRLR